FYIFILIPYTTLFRSLEIAKGMMQFSSNACTDYLINEVGVDVINQSIEALKLNHDRITYLTPPILIPGYLSNKRSVAINKLEGIDRKSTRLNSSHVSI